MEEAGLEEPARPAPRHDFCATDDDTLTPSSTRCSVK
jgi:hypothetical protein